MPGAQVDHVDYPMRACQSIPLSRPCQARASPFGAGVKSLVLPSPWRAVAKSGPTQSSAGAQMPVGRACSRGWRAVEQAMLSGF